MFLCVSLVCSWRVGSTWSSVLSTSPHNNVSRSAKRFTFTTLSQTQTHNWSLITKLPSENSVGGHIRSVEIIFVKQHQRLLHYGSFTAPALSLIDNDSCQQDFALLVYMCVHKCVYVSMVIQSGGGGIKQNTAVGGINNRAVLWQSTFASAINRSVEQHSPIIVATFPCRSKQPTWPPVYELSDKRHRSTSLGWVLNTVTDLITYFTFNAFPNIPTLSLKAFMFYYKSQNVQYSLCNSNSNKACKWICKRGIQAAHKSIQKQNKHI